MCSLHRSQSGYGGTAVHKMNLTFQLSGFGKNGTEEKMLGEKESRKRSP